MDRKKGCRKNFVACQAACLALMLGLTGCTSLQQTAAETQAGTMQPLTEQETVTAETVETTAVVAEPADSGMRGSGEILYASEVQPLTEEQEQLILDYMNLYFASLEDFEPQEEIAALFSDEEQAALADSAIDFQISLRQMQDADYTLASWSYSLTLNEITQEEDGSLHIFARENNIQNFNQNPEIASERYGGYHLFELEQMEGSWKIRSHMMFDAVYMMLWGEGGGEEAALRYAEAVPEYLRLAQEQLQEREADREREPGELQAQYAYDRQAAAAYADRYVDERNDAWPDYAGSGGNCQNFASQVLLAGGIPMDIYGDAVWKWYSDEVSNSPGAQGRSSSWTGVNQFVEYAAANNRIRSCGGDGGAIFFRRTRRSASYGYRRRLGPYGGDRVCGDERAGRGGGLSGGFQHGQPAQLSGQSVRISGDHPDQDWRVE